MSDRQIPLADIQAARRRVAEHILSTPVTRDEGLGLWLKWENRQITGSYKPRGALNMVLSLDRSALERGLIACSAGNHGQGVALAGQKAGASVAIYVPESTPRIKLDKMRALGAKVILVPGLYGDAEAAAMQAAREQGKVYVSPYNDPLVMAGAGTVALDWLEQTPGLGAVLIPVGGGGLISGFGSAARGLRPGLTVFGVQSEASAFMHAEYYRGNSSDVPDLPTLTDGLAGSIEPGSATIPLTRQIAAGILLVSEEEVERAIAYAYHRHGEVVEGSGAVGLAAVMAGKVESTGSLGLLVTGGNIDPDKHAAICARWPDP
jgi:threonine dehydratase